MTKKHIEEAAQAHSTLNAFYLVIAILESGALYGGGAATANRIIALCKKEAQTQLRRYDRAVEAASTEKP